jgi:flagellar biosynthesis component FlhA
MSALEGKSIPILTLDDKWHQLFTQTEMTPEIENLADELNALVERDGRIRLETKKIKKLKKTLLSEIVPLRDKANKLGNAPAIEKEISERTRLISECNEKLAGSEDELLDLSRQIYDVDYKLMVETMNVCYERLHENTDYIRGLDEWISKVRVELKKNVIRLQEAEMENYNLYSYMHQIFGPEVIEIFDMKYDPDHRHPIRRPLEGDESEYVE